MKLGRISCYYITGLKLKNDGRSVSILLCCLSNKISSSETPVRCWYGPGAETCLSHDEQCPVPMVNSQSSHLCWCQKTAQALQRWLNRTPETVCWTAGDPIHPYHPTTLDRAAADEWKLESPPLPAPTCGTITATVINHASPFANAGPILLILRYFSTIKALNRTT